MTASRVMLVRLGGDSDGILAHPRGVHLPFTLKYLQSLLIRRGYQVHLEDGHAAPGSARDLVSNIVEWRPDAAVISLTPLERERLGPVAAAVRRQCRGIAIAVGQDVSMDPAHYSNGSSEVDLAIPGESEVACAETIEAIEDPDRLAELKENFRGLLLRGETIQVDRLDDLPLPVYAPGELERYPHAYPMPMGRRAVWGQLLATRGCPYPCMFCTPMIRESYGARFRQRDPGRVAEEMLYLKRMGATVLSFNDDNMTTDPAFVEALCREIIRRRVGLPWIAHCRVDNLTMELARHLRRAGCALLRFGIESPSSRIIRLLKKGAGVSDWRAAAQQAVRTAHRIGIPTLGLFIIGNPTETEGEIQETIRFATEIPLEFIQVHFFTPYLGTGAYRNFRERVTPSASTGQHHYRAPEANLSQVETRRLVQLRACFYRRFYLRPGWLLRHAGRYGRFYLRNPGLLAPLTAPLIG